MLDQVRVIPVLRLAKAAQRVQRLWTVGPISPFSGRANEPLDAPLGYETRKQLADERDSAIVVFGMGLGHAVRAIRGAGARIAFVFEPDPGIVRQYLEGGPWTWAGSTSSPSSRSSLTSGEGSWALPLEFT